MRTQLNMKVIEMDHETMRRQKRLAKFQESQHVDVFVGLAWMTGVLIVLVWGRLLYIVAKAGVQEIAHLVNR